ncbi:NUDIX domain-containing protein [Natronomonas salina]|uniref:NUDIX domain-containing protein n=1 Tax=Natronomonas salina TaxID=1710540 RepID=UPI0015B45185|nr:NUDIX domain-containing protein [Natronomonas salina]QLD89365.1 NUDIX domain-containing protein [Natronomonas salina]
MDERAVVTCFLRHGPDVLLLRRSDAVGTYPGRWGGVSGFAEGTPDEAARWEIHEEVGLLGAADVVRSGEPLHVEDESRGVRWVVHPYLFDCATTDVEPNEEVAEYEWVQPPAILDRETVPRLWETYAAVAPTVETVRGDDDHGSAYVSLRALEVLRDRATETGSGDGDYAALAALARDLKAARPSMGVVANRVNRVLSEADATPESVLEAALDGCERAVRADGEAAANAAEVVGDRVLTLSRSGTVLDALRSADPEAVFVAESRPAKEGVGVARELAEADAPPDVSLCVDAAVGHVVAEEAVDTVLVGADSVLSDGAVVNKVGTRLAALAARESDVDCYAVCSRDKVVPEAAVELESGPPKAVHERSAPFEVLNPTFERTPAGLFAGVVTEDGVLSVGEVESVAANHADLGGWDE